MKKSLALIVIVILISIFPRLWELNKYPPVVVDEPAYIRDIDKMVQNNNFYPADFQWDGSQATFVYIPTIILNKLFISDSLLALRTSSVIAGLLALIPFFLLVKRNTNDTVAFSTTLLFSFSYYFLQFSRVGWGVVWATTLGLYLIWVIENLKNKNDFLKVSIAGLFAALTFYTYRAGEIYIVAASIYLTQRILISKELFMKRVTKIVLFFLIFLTISSPWIIKINSNPDFFNLRSRVVSIQNVDKPYQGLYKDIDILKYQITTSFKSWIFFLPSDKGNHETPRYLPKGYPTVNPLITVLFLAGVVIALINLKRYYIWFFIYISGVIFGQILTVYPPNGARGLIILPIVYLFSSLSLFYIYKEFSKYRFIGHILVLISFIMAFLDFYFYTQWMTWIKV